MITKSFNKQMFNSIDAKSRVAVIKYFATQGIELQDNANIYGIDVVSPDGKIKIEIEHRGGVFTGDYFHYDTIHIPERKQKFVMDDDANYCVINLDFSYALIARNSDIKKYQDTLHEVPNTAVSSGEKFYDIPKKLFRLVKLT